MKSKAIRPYAEPDVDDVVGLWHRAGLAEYTYIPTWQVFTLEKCRTVFLERVAPKCDVWVAAPNGDVVAYLAIDSSYIDRLYVDPPYQRQGWGTAFVEHAKTLSPRGLELHTHQQNVGARALYERHGFTAVRFGISPAPENIPDVEYHWRPG